MSNLPEEIRAELRKRRAAHTDGTDDQWDAAEDWVARSFSLIRPGGVVSQLMPDGKPLIARKPE